MPPGWLHAFSGGLISALVSFANNIGRLQGATICICFWRSPWCPPFGEDRAAEWRMWVVEDSVTCLFLKTEDTASWRHCFPNALSVHGPPISMFVHWLDLNVRFPTVQGKQWGGAELRVPDVHCYLQQAAAVPTAGRAPCIPLTCTAPTSRNSFRFRETSYHIPVSGRKIWLITFFHSHANFGAI